MLFLRISAMSGVMVDISYAWIPLKMAYILDLKTTDDL